MNLYQQAKNQAVSLICFGDIHGLKVLQSDWLSAKCLYLSNKSFPKYGTRV